MPAFKLKSLEWVRGTGRNESYHGIIGDEIIVVLSQPTSVPAAVKTILAEAFNMRLSYDTFEEAKEAVRTDFFEKLMSYCEDGEDIGKDKEVKSKPDVTIENFIEGEDGEKPTAPSIPVPPKGKKD